MINDKELEEAADTYTSEYDAKLARPELKPLHLGYREEKAKIKKHFIEGARWAQGRCEEKIEELREYATHKDSCIVWNFGNASCTCGLEKIGGIG